MWSSQHINLDFKSLNSWWKKSHAYVPVSMLLEDRIRVFVSFWDLTKQGRLGYIDVRVDNPYNVIGISKDPILDLGIPGTFDEHGVTPLSIVKSGDKHYLYYAGWQRHPITRYHLFTGLAISHDGGRSFARFSKTPIIDRSGDCYQVRTGGFVMNDEGLFRCWFAEQIDGHQGKYNTPSYNWSYMESENGLVWPSKGKVIKYVKDDIFGYGRSAVIKHNNHYKAWVSVRRLDGYKIGYCRSKDGVNWSEFDFEKRGVPPNKNCEFSNKETAFPSLIFYKDKVYMFYNGNNFGEKGLMVATSDTQQLFEGD
jgi:hypothetical protein